MDEEEEEEEKRGGAAKRGRDKREGAEQLRHKREKERQQGALERREGGREESRGEFMKQWSVIGGFRSRSAFLTCEDIE